MDYHEIQGPQGMNPNEFGDPLPLFIQHRNEVDIFGF